MTTELTHRQALAATNAPDDCDGRLMTDTPIEFLFDGRKYIARKCRNCGYTIAVYEDDSPLNFQVDDREALHLGAIELIDRRLLGAARELVQAIRQFELQYQDYRAAENAYERLLRERSDHDVDDSPPHVVLSDRQTFLLEQRMRHLQLNYSLREVALVPPPTRAEETL